MNDKGEKKLPIFTQGSGQCLAIVGATGTVGLGKILQFAILLYQYGIRIIAIGRASSIFDEEGARDALISEFGTEVGEKIFQSITFLKTNQDGSFTNEIKDLDVRVALEGLPEDLDIKWRFFKAAREAWQKAILLSASSSITAEELFRGIESSHLCTNAHPFYPPKDNRHFEVVRPGDGATIDQETFDLLMEFFSFLGLIPVPVKGAPSLALNRIFCFLLNWCLRFMEETGATPEQVDKLCMEIFGKHVHPFGAHDFIPKANLLTWICLCGLMEHYGGSFFTPHPKLVQAAQYDKDSVDFKWYQGDATELELDDAIRTRFREYILGGLAIVVSQILREGIASAEALDELTVNCTLFHPKGIIALLQAEGSETVIALAEKAIDHCGIDRSFFHSDVFVGEGW